MCRVHRLGLRGCNETGLEQPGKEAGGGNLKFSKGQKNDHREAGEEREENRNFLEAGEHEASGNPSSRQSRFPNHYPLLSTSLVSAPLRDNGLQNAQDGSPNVTSYTRKAQSPQALRPKVKGSCLQGTGPKRIGLWPWLS